MHLNGEITILTIGFHFNVCIASNTFKYLSPSTLPSTPYNPCPKLWKNPYYVQLVNVYKTAGRVANSVGPDQTRTFA